MVNELLSELGPYLINMFYDNFGQNSHIKLTSKLAFSSILQLIYWWHIKCLLHNVCYHEIGWLGAYRIICHIIVEFLRISNALQKLIWQKVLSHLNIKLLAALYPDLVVWFVAWYWLVLCNNSFMTEILQTYMFVLPLPSQIVCWWWHIGHSLYYGFS